MAKNPRSTSTRKPRREKRSPTGPSSEARPIDVVLGEEALEPQGPPQTVLDALARDHRGLEQMLTDLAGTSGAQAEHRSEVFANLQTLLAAHARAEEEVVYRALRERLPDEEKVLEAFEEHHLADVLLQELASALPGDAAWAAKAKVFEEALRHHIKEEELDLFPMLEDQFDTATLAQMGREFRALKHERLEAVLGALRRATPAFAGRAVMTAQVAAGRLARRGELYVRRVIARRQGRD